MLKSFTVYRMKGADIPAQVISDALQAHQFVPCGKTQAKSAGWVPPRGEAWADHCEPIEGGFILALQTEAKILPASVVADRVEAMAAKLEESTGRKPGSKARKDLKEQATHELLPEAFTKRGRVLLMAVDGLLLVGSASQTVCDEIACLLTRAVEGLGLHLLTTQESPASVMAAWLMDGQPAEHFTIGRQCVLKSHDEMKSVVRYGSHALDIDNVREHIKIGKAPQRLELTYKDRISFVLDDVLRVHGLQFLDLAMEGIKKPNGKGEAFDADAALASGELRALLPALIAGMGGEHQFMDTEAAGESLFGSD